MMNLPFSSLLILLIPTAGVLIITQQPPSQGNKPAAISPPAQAATASPGVGAPDNSKLPMTSLAPAKLIPNLSSVHYRISTSSPDCQAFFDQGLGCLYSYVWMEASRSFETAVQKDPDCAVAWWGLSRALDRWGRGDAAN